MTQYRRIYVPGASWFFTVNLAQKKGNYLLVEHIDLLREAFQYVKNRHPFYMDAVVIMPNHIHCIWTLPEGDTNYSLRWRLLKAFFLVEYQKAKLFLIAEKSVENVVYGNVAFGRTY